MVKIIGGKELEAVTASNVENNSIFLDASDNKIKIKDNSGTVLSIQELSADSSCLALKNLCRTLIDREGVYSNDTNDMWGDAYIDSNGREDSVDLTNYGMPYFDDTNLKYIGLNDSSNTDTTHDPDSFYDPNNAFNHNDTNYAYLVGISSTKQLGKTFDSKTIYKVRVKCSAQGTNGSIKLQSYDGSSWNDVQTLDSGSDPEFNGEVVLNSSVQGLRVQFIPNSGSWNNKVYLLYYGVQEESIITHTIPAGTFNSTISHAIGTAIVEDWETGADIQFKLTNTGGDDSGWLDYNAINNFTAFIAEPDTLIVKLIPKSSSPTAGTPSIRAFAVRAW